MTTSLKTLTVGLAVAAGALLETSALAQDGEIIFLSGPLTDPFFGTMKAGTDAAAELSIAYQYGAPADFNDIVAIYTPHGRGRDCPPARGARHRQLLPGRGRAAH